MVKHDNARRDGGTWPLGWRVVVSVLLLVHLLGLVAGPAAVAPTSPLAGELFRCMRWYAEPMFLNHGYRFFAPDPGPSFLVRYEIDLPEGRTVKGVLPDLKTQWPRVLYHRHFMLTSRLQGGPQDPAVQTYGASYARHLFNRYGAKEVRLWLVRHDLPDPESVKRGRKLTDPALYEEFPLATYPPQEEEIRPPDVPESLRPGPAPESVPLPAAPPGPVGRASVPGEEVLPPASLRPAGPVSEAPR